MSEEGERGNPPQKKRTTRPQASQIVLSFNLCPYKKNTRKILEEGGFKNRRRGLGRQMSVLSSLTRTGNIPRILHPYWCGVLTLRRRGLGGNLAAQDTDIDTAASPRGTK